MIMFRKVIGFIDCFKLKRTLKKNGVNVKGAKFMSF